MSTATVAALYGNVIGPGERMLLGGVCGSHAFGLAHEGSDIDRHGVYVTPTTTLLGLGGGTWQQHSRTSHTPVDIALHEAGKFVRLAMGCNPSALDVLWLDGWEVTTLHGGRLVMIRDAFLSAKRVRDAYLGYATSQFARLSRTGRFNNVPRARIEKHARHLRRLVDQGVLLWTTGRMRLRVDDPDELFAFGRAVADDPTEAERVMARAEHTMNTTHSALPEQPDTERIEEWLQTVRHDHYQHEHEWPSLPTKGSRP